MRTRDIKSVTAGVNDVIDTCTLANIIQVAAAENGDRCLGSELLQRLSHRIGKPHVPWMADDQRKRAVVVKKNGDSTGGTSDLLNVLDSTGEDLWTVTPAVGGLVSAIEPVLRDRGGTWIGWPGIAGKIPEEPFAQATRNAGYKIVPVALSETERDEFYYGYSNEVIWPLFHDLQNFCNFDPAYWQAYQQVNVRFAD